MSESKTARKMRASLFTIIALIACLCVTTFALVYSIVTVDDNFFRTGTVKINLNDGKPVIEEHEFLFEPGMTVVKPFFLENESTGDVWFRLYFTNVEGGLADVLEVTVKDGDSVLYEGMLADMTREKSVSAEDALGINEHRELTITFHFPESAENEAEDLYLSFDIGADAVQVKNNPNKLFD